MRKASSLSALASYDDDDDRLEDDRNQNKRAKRSHHIASPYHPKKSSTEENQTTASPLSKLKKSKSANDLYDWWSQKLEEEPSLPTEKTEPFIYKRILHPAQTDIDKRLDSVAPKCRDDLKVALARASLIANSMQEKTDQYSHFKIIHLLLFDLQL